LNWQQNNKLLLKTPSQTSATLHMDESADCAIIRFHDVTYSQTKSPMEDRNHPHA